MASINERIRAAVTPFVLECVPHVYEGNGDTYAVFEYRETPIDFIDNEPMGWKAEITLYLILPLEKNSLQLRGDLSRAILAAGFTAPTVEDAGDGTEQCWQFQFEGELEDDDG